MEILVRTDLIDPHTWLDATLNDDILRKIHLAGGYMMQQQFITLMGLSNSASYRVLQKLISKSLVGAGSLGLVNFVYLRAPALTYLIGTKQIRGYSPSPTTKRLLTSVARAEYMLLYPDKAPLITSSKFSELARINEAKPFFDFKKFLSNVNQLHIYQVYLDSLMIAGDAVVVLFAIVDLMNSKYWYYLTLLRLVRLIKFLNQKSTIEIKILVKSEDRLKAVKEHIDSIYKSNESRLTHYDSSLQDKIITQVKAINLIDLGTQKYFMHTVIRGV